MKFKFIYTLFIFLLGITLFLGNSNGRADGNNWGNTGAPGDETLSNGNPRTCQTCHATGSIQVTLDIEVLENGDIIQSYIPGQTYDVQVRINHVAGPAPDGYGFQLLSLIDADNSDVNGWSNPSANTKIATASNTGRSYAEQNGVGSNNTFMVQWTAPEVGSGNVTFYSCGNGVDGTGTTGNDGAACSTLELTEADPNSTADLAFSDIQVYPNPAQNWLQVQVQNQVDASNSVVRILTLDGKTVLEDIMPSNKNQQMDISSFTKGIYLIQVQSKETILTKKFIKI